LVTPSKRIYDRKVVLSRYGINVRGRSSVLRLNYRSTAEIVRWAVTLLGDKPAEDLDDGEVDKRGYRSVLRGASPGMMGCSGTNAELKHIVAEVRNLLDGGAKADERRDSEIRLAHDQKVQPKILQSTLPRISKRTNSRVRLAIAG
jgi:hypothetical protein